MRFTDDEKEAIRRVVARAFARRTGHDGTLPVVYRQIGREELARLLGEVIHETERVHDERITA